MTNEQERIEEVAFLRARGKRMKEIVEILQLPPATVDALLKKAEGQGLVKETIQFDYEKVSPARISQLRSLDHVEHLRDRLRGLGVDPLDRSKHIFQQIHVFDSGSIDDTARGMETRLARFGREAATAMAEFIFQAHLIGVAWGATLACVIRGLQSDRFKTVRGQKHIRFVPTCGEPYGNSSRADSSSLLVAELEERVNENSRKHLSLTGIPVVLPKKFAETGEDKVIRRFIQHCPAYREIFSAPEAGGSPLVDKLETIFTSVGGAEWNWRMCGLELCEIGGIERAVFNNVALGDVGGVLLPRSEYPKPEEIQLLKEIAALWTGITHDQYRNVALKGDRHRGVVVFAVGANKARIVYRAIRAGLINHLVCDKALTWALTRECGAPAPDEVPLRR
jgi:DNA-binding transcriptional regulator LsrR (DeoR family)